MDQRMPDDLVMAAMDMAMATRGGEVTDMVFHHDHGTQGEIKWSSQHLDSGGGRWRQCGSGSAKSSSIAGRFRHRDGQRLPGVKTGSVSGLRSLAA